MTPRSLITFFVPLRSRRTTRNWELVCRLLENTLRSIFGQSDPRFDVLVICHELPTLTRDFGSRLRFLEVDLPVPSGDLKDSTMHDKWMKLACGLISVRDRPAAYSMFVDADDLVSSRIAAFVAKDRNPNGYIIKKGYWYTAGSNWMQFKNDFNCGTNSILRLDALHLPASLDSVSRMQCIALRSGHLKIESNMLAAGTPLAHLPFAGAAYVQHTEQWTQMSSPGAFSKRTLRKRAGALKRFMSSANQYRYFGKALQRELSVSPADYRDISSST